MRWLKSCRHRRGSELRDHGPTDRAIPLPTLTVQSKSKKAEGECLMKHQEGRSENARCRVAVAQLWPSTAQDDTSSETSIALNLQCLE